MRYLVLLLLAASPMAYAGKYRPIYNADFSYDSNIHNAQVKKAIKKSLISRGWTMGDAKRGKIKAKIFLRTHVAEVVITYGGGNIKIDYVTSTNLGYRMKKGQPLIHRNYNNWIINLERDISVNLT